MSDTIDFRKYRVRYFAPYLYDLDVYGSNGCGPLALSLITGVDPFSWPILHSYTDKLMVATLRTEGYTVIPVDNCDLMQNAEFMVPRFEASHVILMSHLATRTDDSWSVVHGNKFYHKGICHDLNSYLAYNFPPLTRYLITHPNWLYSGVKKRPVSQMFKWATEQVNKRKVK